MGLPQKNKEIVSTKVYPELKDLNSKSSLEKIQLLRSRVGRLLESCRKDSLKMPYKSFLMVSQGEFHLRNLVPALQSRKLRDTWASPSCSALRLVLLACLPPTERRSRLKTQNASSPEMFSICTGSG